MSRNPTNQVKRTEIGEIGEFGLIKKLKNMLTHQNPLTRLSIGDDGAVVDMPTNEQMIVSTDLLIEGIHFDLAYMPLKHLGYKAVAVNVSDIAAMNGIPSHITVGLGISNRFSVEAIEELYDGIKQAAEEYGIDVIGGDTTASRSGLVLSITVVGHQHPENIVKRSGAKANDLICVSGDLGGALMGLQILEREKHVFLTDPTMQPELSGYEYVVGRQLKPKARMDIVYELRDKSILPSAMIDVSDGLASELFHLSEQSKIGVILYEEHIPIASETFNVAAEFSLDPNMCALNGGEDYELLFTIHPTFYEAISKMADITIIGHITKDPNERKLVTRGGLKVDLKAQGWLHFE